MRHRSKQRRFSAASSARMAKGRIAFLEALESRQMLSANPIQEALIGIHGSDMLGKDGPLANVGLGLSLLYHEHENYLDQGLAEPFEPSSELFKVDKEGRVVVDLVVDSPADSNSWQHGTDLQQNLINLGLKITGTWGAMVSGLLPISAIPQLAALEGIRSAMATSVVTNVGLTDTQGDVAQRSDEARGGFGVDGSGITVGVLSDSYDTSGAFEIRAVDDVASGDLPGPTNPLGYTTPVNVLQDFAGGTIDEGRAMLQIVHDVAPGADLAFHTALGGQAGFANGIVDLATEAGADVIVDDIIYFAEPMFQDGIIAQAVDQVVNMGVSYFSAAFNNNRTSYQSSFVASGELGPSGGQLHDFDPGGVVDAFQQVTIAPGSSVILSFQWDDPFASVSRGPGAASDLDIYLLDAPSPSGDVLAASANFNLDADPVEILGFQNTTGAPITAYLAIENFAGPDPGLMKYVGTVRGGFSIDEYDTNSPTSWGHSNAVGAESVGAAAFFQTPEFGVSPPEVEPFSSVGGVPILFDAAGNRLATPDVRMKPEITAPDGGNTTFFISDSNADPDLFPNFFGTSAAAPHAAAVAALMLDQAGGPGTQTPSQIYANLEATAIDMDDPFTPGFDVGFDFQTGYGLINANSAVLATPAGVPPLTEPFPVPLFLVDPLGGLIYDGSVDSDISEVGDTDSFTIEVDARQTISLAVRSDNSLRARVEVFDPLGVSVGSATAPSPGAAALLQTLSASRAGTYTVVVSGVNSGTPGTPDFNGSINQQSSVFSPNVLNYNFDGVSAPGGDASLSAFAVADLGDTSEFLRVEAEGIFSADLFVGAGNNLPRSETVTIPAATMAALAANGVANFTVTPSSAVGNEGPTQLVLQLAYPGVPADGTGKYNLDLTLNAAIETEPFGLGSNDSRAQAQDIGASFIPLGSDRGAVVGTLTGPNSFDPPAPIPVREIEPNNSRAGAQNLDGGLWTVAPDPNIQDAKTIAHVSVLGSGDGTFDYYSFTVSTPGAEGIFDIDFANFDSQLFLYDSGGTLLASNDDTVPADPGSASVLDAKIDFAFSSPGTYVIAVGEFASEDAGGFLQGNAPDSGESYRLQVSVENHPIDPGTPVPQDDRDFYRFDAVQGDVITLATTAVSGSADSMSLQLQDSSGAVLAGDSSGAGNVNRYIQDFEVPATGPYFVRVGSANDDVDYSLVITRDATFDLGLPGAQNIDATNTVLGHVGESVAPIEVIEFDELPQQPLDGVSVKGATFDFKIDGADSDTATFGSIGIGAAFLTDPFASGTPAGIVTIDFDTPTPIFGFAAALLTVEPVVSPGVTVTLLDEASTVIDTIDVTLFNEGSLFISEAIFSYAGTPVSSAVLDFNEAANVFQFGLDNVTFQGERVVDADQYEISAEAGDVIQLSTLTPAGGPFEFVNEIDPRIEVRDPNGNLVAVNDHGAGDGRNALVTFTAERTGTFTIRVTAAGPSGGEYVLHADQRRQPGAVLENGVLRIFGTDRQDIIFVENGTSPVGTVEVRASFLDDIRTFSAAAIERIEVFGRNGWDRIFVTHPINVPTLIDGGKGSDVLEAGSGPATLIGGQGDDALKGSKQDDILDGGDGNDILKGRGGNDILIGGDGLDRVDGGGGRDILIGGAGPDQLGGSWGSDILIEGTTSYDNFYEALQLILAEWTSSRGYLKRVDNIRHGTGPILGGTGVHLQRGDTVLNDGTQEIELRGMQSRDWFFATLNEVDDKQPNEERN